MTPTQFLLTKIAEHSAEISRAALVATQEGLSARSISKDWGNRVALHGALNGLSAAVILLGEEDGYKFISEQQAIELSKEIIRHRHELSILTGYSEDMKL